MAEEKKIKSLMEGLAEQFPYGTGGADTRPNLGGLVSLPQDEGVKVIEGAAEQAEWGRHNEPPKDKA